MSLEAASSMIAWVEGPKADLGQEPLRPDHRRQLGPEDLERHLPVVADVFRQVDRGHAAGADLAVDPVAVGQGGLEPAEKFGHQNGFGWRRWKMLWGGGLG
jgi:hypothetical protein